MVEIFVCKCCNNICLHCLSSTWNMYSLNLTLTPCFFSKNLFSSFWHMQTSHSISSNQDSYYQVYFVWNFSSLSAAFIFHLFNSFFWPQYVLCPILLELLEVKSVNFTSVLVWRFHLSFMDRCSVEKGGCQWNFVNVEYVILGQVKYT